MTLSLTLILFIFILNFRYGSVTENFSVAYHRYANTYIQFYVTSLFLRDKECNQVSVLSIPNYVCAVVVGRR